MRDLLEEWGYVAGRIKGHKKTFLFFDYDGTLTPIVRDPNRAVLAASTRRLIKRLIRKRRYSVAIISGRSLKDIMRLVRIPGIIYAGNHGLEIKKGKEVILKTGASERDIIKSLGLYLQRVLRRIRGVKIEDKGLTLSIHYRNCSFRGERAVKKLFDRSLSVFKRRKYIKTSAGKKVLEVRPYIKWDKGRAVLEILKDERCLPVYLGDDATDIDAFKAVRKKKGISIYVGPPHERRGADYYLRDTDGVVEFIRRCLEL